MRLVHLDVDAYARAASMGCVEQRRELMRALLPDRLIEMLTRFEVIEEGALGDIRALAHLLELGAPHPKLLKQFDRGLEQRRAVLHAATLETIESGRTLGFAHMN